MSRATVLRVGAVLPLAGLAACSSDEPSSAPSSTSSPATPEASSTPSRTPTPTPAPSDESSSAAPRARKVRPRIAGTVASDLGVPWNIVFLPGGAALVSARDAGRVLRVDPRGGGVRVVGEVPGVVSSVSRGGEGGLLGLALHPDFAKQPWLYAYLSTGSDNRVVRMRYSRDRLGAPRALLTGIETSVHHNGGGLAFGPDGHLYVSTGDAEDTSNAQDRSSLNGKILRLTATGGKPAGNPFDNLVWSYGHRNVEGLAFDEDGRLWASEFGDQRKDELNRIVKGADYGWPDVEGRDGPGGYADPLAEWLPDDCSPSGIAVVAGRAWLGALQGRCVYSVVLAGAHKGRVERYFTGQNGRLRAVAAAPDGSLWVGTSNRDGRADPGPRDDRILRVTL